MERYLWIQTITGVIIAVGSWMVMALVGLDNAVFWAFLIFVVNYIPIVGAVAAIVLPAIFAWVQFDGFARALVVLAGLGSITFVVGNILLPRMQGDSLNMGPPRGVVVARVLGRAVGNHGDVPVHPLSRFW